MSYKKTYTRPDAVIRTPFIPKYPPSEEQTNIFAEYNDTSNNIRIPACAGSGKSTTLTWLMSLPKSMNIPGSALLAFGKDIVRDIEPRCARNVVVKTGHSFGYGALAAKIGKPFLIGNKVKKILQKYPFLNPDIVKDGPDKTKVYQRLNEADKLIEKMRVNLTDETDELSIAGICKKYGIDYDAEVVSILPDVFYSILNCGNAIDFTDMLYLPIRMGLSIPKFKMLYVDEVQDLNPLMIEYVRQMSEGRVSLVGDRNQCIFVFMGSDSKAFDSLKSEFNCVDMPLTTCYRCGSEIVKLAQTIVHDIYPWEHSPAGEVNELKELNYDMEEGSMILSRRNASLVRPCFALLKRGKKAVIRGKNIDNDVKDFIQSLKATNIIDLIDKVDAYTEKKLTKLMSAQKVNTSAIETLQDQKEIVTMFAEEADTVSDVVNKIDSIFSDDIKGIVLSSVHKSKGLEADHVSIVDYDRIRMNYDKMTEDDHEAERCIHYVAITRAKTKLDLIRN